MPAPKTPMRCGTGHASVRGFTLIELLVALGIMALMAGLSWRGLDAMARAQTHIQQRGDALLTLQAGLTQWAADLDAQVQLPQTPALDWDGRVLRILRHSTLAPGDGLLVVAWTHRTINGMGQWLRWQSPPLTTRGALQAAQARASQWGQNPGDEERRYEVSIAAVEQWRVLYFRNGAWSAAAAADSVAPPAPAAPSAPVATPPPGASTASGTGSGTGVAPVAAAPTPPPIDAVRLVLTLPPGEALSGNLTRDWMRATLAPGK